MFEAFDFSLFYVDYPASNLSMAHDSCAPLLCTYTTYQLVQQNIGFDGKFYCAGTRQCSKLLFSLSSTCPASNLSMAHDSCAPLLYIYTTYNSAGRCENF